MDKSNLLILFWPGERVDCLAVLRAPLIPDPGVGNLILNQKEAATIFFYRNVTPVMAPIARGYRGFTKCNHPKEGASVMGDKGQKDKGKRETQKKAQKTKKEKRQEKLQKKNQPSSGVTN